MSTAGHLFLRFAPGADPIRCDQHTRARAFSDQVTLYLFVSPHFLIDQVEAPDRQKL